MCRYFLQPLYTYTYQPNPLEHQTCYALSKPSNLIHIDLVIVDLALLHMLYTYNSTNRPFE